MPTPMRLRERLRRRDLLERVLLFEHKAERLLRRLGKNGVHHSRSIEKYLGELIPPAILQSNSRLPDEEIYLLLRAAYLHDIGRTKGAKGHEAESAKMIRENWRKYGLDDEHVAEAVAQICAAHAPESVHPISDLKLSYSVEGLSREIRLRFLGALLRLADEIDNCYLRVHRTKGEEQSPRHQVRGVLCYPGRGVIEIHGDPTPNDCSERLAQLQSQAQRTLDSVAAVLRDYGVVYHEVNWVSSSRPHPDPSVERWFGKYCDGLHGDIQDDLVKDLLRHSRWEDHCIEPFVRRYAAPEDKGFSVCELAKSTRSAIVCEPGSGKTTCLHWLALYLLEQRPLTILPVRIALAGYKPADGQASDRVRRKADAQLAEAFINRQLNRMNAPSLRELVRIEGLSLLFLLDGFDQMDETGQEDMCSYLDGLKDHPTLQGGRASFVITSRPECFDRLPACDRYEMVPITLNRIPQFAQVRLERSDTRKWFLEWVIRTPSVHRLASNPLALSIMLLLLREDDNRRGPGPRGPSDRPFGGLNKTQLCRRVLEYILAEKHRRGEARYRSLSRRTISRLEAVLRRLAYKTMLSGARGSFSRRELEAAAHRLADSLLNQLPSLLSGQLGIIREKSAGFEFYHPWYQELLAAEQVMENQQDLVGIVRELSNPKLAPCLQHVVGLSDSELNPFDVLFWVQMHDPFNYCRALSQSELTDDERLDLLTKLIAECEREELPARVTVARALAETGSRCSDVLHHIAHAHESRYARRAALEALAVLESFDVAFHDFLPMTPDYSPAAQRDAVNQLDQEKRRLDRLLLAILVNEGRSLAADPGGLIWHVLELVGGRKFSDPCDEEKAIRALCSLSQTKAPRSDEAWVTAGDALWALGRLRRESVDVPGTVVRGLLRALRRDGEHVQGHAIRTIGRLRIRRAMRALREYLRRDEARFKWIVPQAAAKVGGKAALGILCEAVQFAHQSKTEDAPLIIGAALDELRQMGGRVSKQICSIVREYCNNTTQINFLERTLGSVAQAALDHLEPR